MRILTHPLSLFSATSKSHYSDLFRIRNIKRRHHGIRVSVQPPPPDFDFREEILSESWDSIAETHPQLLDLADNGSLIVIKKSQYGPVPSWRTEFVEPEAIWLIGTTHISQESATDVERVIRSVNPDNVVVELCRSRDWCGGGEIQLVESWCMILVCSQSITSHFAESICRAGIMYTTPDGELSQKSNMFSLSGTGFFGAVGRSVDLGGQTALVLRLLLAIFSSKISSEVNRPFGDEFRAARKVSEEIGAQIVLGDRPIEITLQRAWNSLMWKDKLSWLSSVISGITSSSNLSSNMLQQESSTTDSNFGLYEQLSSSYPSLLLPLIHERDTYLAWSLKRSKAVNNSKRVVGVIGKAHMNGVIYSLISDQGNLRFSDLTGKRPSRDGSGWIATAFKNLIRDTVISIIIWLLYEQIKAEF